MTIIVTVRLGINGCTKEEEVEIDDDVLEALSEDEKESYIANMANEAVHEMVETTYKVV